MVSVGLEIGLATVSGRRGPPRLLDPYADSLQAIYSLRQLLASWLGPLVTVRRDSDNATLAIYPAGDGWLDTAALLAWCGSASAFVTRWWDQSGLSRHAEQATAAAQPRLVNAGVLATAPNGRPWIYFNGSQSVTAAVTAGPLAADSLSGALLLAIEDAAAATAVVSASSRNLYRTTSSIRVRYGSTSLATLSTTTPGPMSAQVLFGGTGKSHGVAVDGTVATSGSVVTAIDITAIGLGSALVGWIGEAVFLTQELAWTSRAALRADHVTSWGTP